MEDIKNKCMTLFLLESLIIQNGRFLSEGFAHEFNDFVYKNFNSNKELFSAIYDIDTLELFIKNNWEILSLEQMYQLINLYHGYEGYEALVDEIGYQTDQKINELALLFTSYHHELVKLYNADPNEYFPKGYPRILQ